MRTILVQIHDAPSTNYVISPERLIDAIRMQVQTIVHAHATGCIPHVEATEQKHPELKLKIENQLERIGYPKGGGQ